jgi:hypothetical protein
MIQYRQGDVLVEKITRIPDDVMPIERDSGRVVLAYGEATGHAHALAAKHVHFYSLTKAADVRYLEVRGRGAWLRHEEHSPIYLPPGSYGVTRQRTYTPEEVRPVAD